MSAETINTKLRQLYSENWEALTQSIPARKGYSFPLLMDANTSYPVAPTKILIVGQQTFGWFGTFGERQTADPIKDLMLEYSNFNRGENYVSSPFWVASHLLQQTINPGSDPYGIMWSNLIRVDLAKERAEPIEENLCLIPLLRQEIEIVKPQVVVFFTGPNYDTRLKSTFSALKMFMIEGYDSRMLSRVVHPDLPFHSYRTYHPGYLKRQGQIMPIVNKIAELVKTEIALP